MLDHVECEKARVGRDPVYDGRFFTGCRTTGIYCRPVCPVRPAHPLNVCFFPSAAAAEAAGFRPCLRCRPETAPFSPAWRGSRVTAERAARLIIEEGALDGDGANVETLAARVGVGGRHLARLFAKHLGATPSQVAKTARVQRAKRLLDGTDLPTTEVALRAGFSSLRRGLLGGLQAVAHRYQARTALSSPGLSRNAPMRLLYSARSPFARLIRIALLETGLERPGGQALGDA